MNQDKRNGFKLGVAFMVVATAIAWLLGLAGKQDEQNKTALAELHSAELSTCWAKANEYGGSCRIEYLKDRTDTIYGAKVIYEK